MNKVVHQTAQAIRLVSDHWWQRVGWWISVSPRLAFFMVGVWLGLYKEEMDDE